ncbi:MAG: signal recognition particle receptor subunit alpha, partial [archaeon]|nr:signal recognition particle receptor subunit alpha [archaeon]
MFGSLKSKLKSIFKKGNDLDESKVYNDEPKPETKTVEEPAVVPKVEEPAPVHEEPAKVVLEVPEVVEPVKPEPVPEKVIETPAPVEKPKEVPVAAKPTKETHKGKKEKLVKGSKKRSSDMLSDSLLSKKIKDDPLDDILDELEVVLLESDVAYPVVQEIIVGVRNNLSGKKYGREYSLEEVIELAVKEAVNDVLQINVFDFDAWLAEQEKPAVIMFVGINGTGKTTAIAKIANRLKIEEKSVVLAACDTFRAGAIEQLTIHADKLNIKIVKSKQDADPASVAYDAIEHAKSKMRDVVLIDTAGRMQTNNNLIAEMKKIVKVA